MPINRHLSFSDRQSEAARMKKLQQTRTNSMVAPVVSSQETALAKPAGVLAPESKDGTSNPDKATVGKSKPGQKTASTKTKAKPAAKSKSPKAVARKGK